MLQKSFHSPAWNLTGNLSYSSHFSVTRSHLNTPHNSSTGHCIHTDTHTHTRTHNQICTSMHKYKHFLSFPGMKDKPRCQGRGCSRDSNALICSYVTPSLCHDPSMQRSCHHNSLAGSALSKSGSPGPAFYLLIFFCSSFSSVLSTTNTVVAWSHLSTL